MNWWLARELSGRDPTLMVFLPFLHNLQDYSGYVHHPYMSGAVPSLTTRLGKAGFSPPASSYLQINAHSDFNFGPSDHFTVSLWCLNQGLASPTGGLVGTYKSGVGGYRLYRDNNSIVFSIADSSNEMSVRANLPSASWQDYAHLLATYDGSKSPSGMRVFVNGVNQTYSPSGSVPSSSVSQPLSIGSVNVGNSQFGWVGNIGLVRVYKRQLFPPEVNSLYAREKNTSLKRKAYKAFSSGPVVSSGNNNLTLYMTGAYVASGNMTLYTQGYDSGNNNVTLYTIGAFLSSGDVPLYTQGYSSGNASAPLFLYNVPPTTYSGQLPLFMQVDNAPAVNSGIQLFVFGSTNSGMFSTMPLYTSGSPLTANIPLYLAGSMTDTVVRNVNLWINGGPYYANNSQQLFICNTQSGVNNGITLYMIGSGTMPGTPNNKNIPLYLERPTSQVMPLYMHGQSIGVSGNVPMYTSGSDVASGATVPLSLPNVVGVNNNSVNLFTSGF